MSGPVSPPLTVREADGSPSGRPINTIVVSNGDLSITGSTATIDTSGSGGTAALTRYQIGFGDASNLMTGSTKLLWDDTAGSERLTVSGTATTTLVFEGAKTSDGTVVDISFKNGSDSTAQIGVLRTGADDACAMIFGTQPTGGNVTERMRIDSAGRVGIGTTPDSAVERLHVKGTGTGDLVRLESTDDGSNSAPDLAFYRSSATPANNDYLGRIDFRGKDNAGNDQDYGVIYGRILSSAGGSEDGAIILKAAQNGDTNPGQSNILIGNTSVSINDGNASYINFFVKGDNDTIINCQASQDNIGIGTAPSSEVERLHVKGTGDGTLVRLESTDAGAGTAPDLELYRNSASPASGDFVGYIGFNANTLASGLKVPAGQIAVKLQDVSGDNVNSDLQFLGRSGNANTAYLILGHDATVFNESNNDIDFKIETTGNSNMFVVDSGNNNVGIGGTPVSTSVLYVKDNGSRANTVLIESTDPDDNDDGPDLVLYRNKDSPTASTDLGVVRFRGRNNASADIDYGYIRTDVVSGFGTSANGLMKLGVVADGTTPTDSLYIDGTGSNPVVGIGAQPTSTAAQFQVNQDATFRSYIESFTSTDATSTEIVRNGTAVYDSGSAGVITVASTGVQGDKVTIVSVGSGGATLAFQPADSSVQTPASLSSGQSETWLCYKDNNWVKVASS